MYHSGRHQDNLLRLPHGGVDDCVGGVTNFGGQILNLHSFFSSLQSMLELEKERIQLLCNNLNQYSQHISLFGQTLTTVSSGGGSVSGVHGKGGRKQFFSDPTLPCLVLQCHTQIHCAISKVDVEKDIQALMEETAILSTENKSEFLLTDYFVSTEWQEMTLTGHLGHVLRRHPENSVKTNAVFSPNTPP